MAHLSRRRRGPKRISDDTIDSDAVPRETLALFPAICFEPLADRALLGVCAALTGPTIDVSLSATNDSASISESGSNIDVFDRATTDPFAESAVGSGSEEGNWSAGELAVCDGAVPLSGSLITSGLSSLAIDSRYSVQSINLATGSGLDAAGSANDTDTGNAAARITATEASLVATNAATSARAVAGGCATNNATGVGFVATLNRVSASNGANLGGSANLAAFATNVRAPSPGDAPFGVRGTFSRGATKIGVAVSLAPILAHDWTEATFPTEASVFATGLSTFSMHATS